MRTTGLVLALVSALGYGASLPLSRLAFDEGTNALSVALLRYVVLTLVLGGWVLATRRQRPALSRREQGYSVLLGVCFAVVSLGTLLGASLMAVSLTVLVFYTHPSMILAVAAILERRRPRPLELVVLLLAFSGLALALDVELGSANATGLAAAGIAALGALATFVLIERALARADAIRSTALAAGAAAAFSALAASGRLAAPLSTLGWQLLGAVVVLFATAVVCMFLAIRHAGSVRASMVLFMEPITAIALSVGLLGEHLSPLQWLGAAMVISAVGLASMRAATASDHAR